MYMYIEYNTDNIMRWSLYLISDEGIRITNSNNKILIGSTNTWDAVARQYGIWHEGVTIYRCDILTNDEAMLELL